MLVMVAAALAVLTAGALLQAKDARLAGGRRAVMRWLALGIPLGLATCGIAWSLAREPTLLWWVPPTGFGPDWRCSENVPPAVRVCLRSP